MRVPGLLGTVVLLVSSLCFASDEAIDPYVNRTVPFVGKDAGERSGETQLWVRPMPRRAQRPGAEESVCYTLRTYVVVREERDSDVITRDGYFTCQPGWKFQIRSAVAEPQNH
jgi:hypothetical protein